MRRFDLFAVLGLVLLAAPAAGEGWTEVVPAAERTRAFFGDGPGWLLSKAERDRLLALPEVERIGHVAVWARPGSDCRDARKRARSGHRGAANPDPGRAALLLRRPRAVAVSPRRAGPAAQDRVQRCLQADGDLELRRRRDAALDRALRGASRGAVSGLDADRFEAPSLRVGDGVLPRAVRRATRQDPGQATRPAAVQGHQVRRRGHRRRGSVRLQKDRLTDAEVEALLTPPAELAAWVRRAARTRSRRRSYCRSRGSPSRFRAVVINASSRACGSSCRQGAVGVSRRTAADGRRAWRSPGDSRPTTASSRSFAIASCFAPPPAPDAAGGARVERALRPGERSWRASRSPTRSRGGPRGWSRASPCRTSRSRCRRRRTARVR